MSFGPVRFFLGAYSPGGYYSLYDWLINLRAANGVYIVKGGPGSGKAEYLKHVAGRLAESGASYQEILSALDPARLDGIVLSGSGKAFIDGNAPHVVEPRYPDVVEKYVTLVNTGENAVLREMRGEIIRLTDERELCYERACRCLAAARSLSDDIFSLIIPGTKLDTITKRAKGVISREIKAVSGPAGGLKKRFLSAVTSAGHMCLFETARALCDKIYEINDDYGLSHFFLSPILNAAQQAGCEVYACYCPLNPEKKLEHVLIPSLSVGFVTSGAFSPYDGTPYRRIRLNPCVDASLVKLCRQRLRFERKTIASLIAETSSSLKQAKDIEDALELIYNPGANYEKALGYAEAAVQELIRDPKTTM